MAGISSEEVDHIAYLARLGLSPEEKTTLRAELSAILDYMQVMDRLNTQEIPPTAQVLPLSNVLRDDQVAPSFPVQDVIANAPRREESFFKIPPVLE